MDRLPLQFLMLFFAGWVNRHQQEMIEYLQEENRFLRAQLGGKRLRFTDVQRRRLARRAHQIGRRGLAEIATLVSPDTLLRWYRELVARKYDGSKKRGPGRPRTSAEVQRLILEMAGDIPRWGYTRIQGALRNLGYEIGRNTIKRILIENGLDPVGGRKTTWKAFLRAHWEAIAATDFFGVHPCWGDPPWVHARLLPAITTQRRKSVMGMVTEDHRNLIDEVGLCYVASASADGVPNVSPKGSIAVLDDDHLVFADIMSPHTRQNLQENSRIAVFVCKPEEFKGFQFKGTAELSSDGAVFDMLVQMIKEKKLKVPPPKHAVKIRVEEVRGLGES